MTGPELAEALRLWREQGEPFTLIEFLMAALDKRDAEAQWETRWANESPGPGWEPLAVDSARQVDILWRRRVST